MGSLFNEKFQELETKFPEKVRLVSSLGKLNYFTAMKQCSFLLGNTSSGIVEAASFNKWVINIGDRQKGRLRNENVLDVPFELDAIEQAVVHVKNRQPYWGENKYVKADTTNKIIEILLSDEKL
jgi:GDP/UDP-N,N'-diacetylbacillosamine 2-epimerase (hydrolysing)